MHAMPQRSFRPRSKNMTTMILLVACHHCAASVEHVGIPTCHLHSSFVIRHVEFMSIRDSFRVEFLSSLDFIYFLMGIPSALRRPDSVASAATTSCISSCAAERELKNAISSRSTFSRNLRRGTVFVESSAVLFASIGGPTSRDQNAKILMKSWIIMGIFRISNINNSVRTHRSIFPPRTHDREPTVSCLRAMSLQG